MNEEWLNRMALAWELRYRVKEAHKWLDEYGSATEVIVNHPNLLSIEA